MESTRNWFITAFEGLVAFVPRLIAGLVILVIGYLIAKVLARVTRSLAARVGFDRFVWRLGLVRRQDDPQIGSRWLGGAVFAIVIVATLIQAARAFHLTFVAEGLGRILGYLPHVLGAAVVFGAALFLGNWVRDRLLGSRIQQPTYGSIRFLPSAVRGLILGAGAFMALRELQIAPEIVNAAFILTLGAVAVAAALAFGLGGRDVARKVAEGWYSKRSGVGYDRVEPPPPPSPYEPGEPFART